MLPEHLRQTLLKLEPLIGHEKARILWKQYQYAEDNDEKNEISAMVTGLAESCLDTFSDLINLPPIVRSWEGVIELGDVSYQGRRFGSFRLAEPDLIKHIGIFGATGSGKTTLAYNILRQLITAGRPFMILDWKRDYRDLLALPEFKDKLKVFTVGRDIAPFYFNPREKPPGVEKHVWEKKLAEIIAHAYLLGPGAMDVLTDAFTQPTFAQMHDYIKKQRKKARELLWWSSAKRSLNSINFPGLYEVVNSPSYDMENLLNQYIVLELDSLSDSDKVFLIGSLLMWIYYYRMAQPDRETWKHTIVLEEAHHLLLKQALSKQENYADVLMREIRVLGEAMIVLDQHPHKLSVSALGNLNTKVCLNLNLGQDIRAMSDAILLKQREYIGKLKVGQAIVKTSSVSEPFMIEIDNFGINKGKISDEALREIMSRNLACLGLNQARFRPASNIRRVPEQATLSPLALVMLADIAQNPFDGIVKRYKRLGIKPYEGATLQAEIINAGAVRPITINGLKLLELTKTGIDILSENNIKPAKTIRGGLEHNYWVDKIQNKLESEGWKVRLEHHNIDIMATRHNDKMAIEVETGKSDLNKSIEKLEKIKANLKIMACTQKDTAIKLKKILPSNPHIKVMLAKELT